MDTVIQNLRRELSSNADEKTRVSGQRFFKEEVKMYGLKTAHARKINQAWFSQVKDKPKEEIFRLCEILWQSGYIEESIAACEWSYFKRKNYKPADFNIFEQWIGKYVSNWATCDTLCNHTVGTFVEMYPEYIENLKKWTGSANRWLRRASAVTLIIPARKGLFLDDIFDIAGKLLPDQDDMVQKGYGWMLKAASQAHLEEVFNFVMANKSSMPRTALRYAIEKMPAELRQQAMEK